MSGPEEIVVAKLERQEIKTFDDNFPVRIASIPRLPILPGLNDPPQLIRSKKILNELAFKLSSGVGQEDFYAYPDANGDGVLTEREVLGLIHSKAMVGHWPIGKKEELQAMLDNQSTLTPEDQLPLIRKDESLSNSRLNLTTALPRLRYTTQNDSPNLKARANWIGYTTFVIPTSPAIGARYISFDLNRDGIVTLAELKEIYTHPELQPYLQDGRLKYQLEINICRASGTLDKSLVNLSGVLGNLDHPSYDNVPRALYFRANKKFPEADEIKLKEGVEAAFKDRSNDSKAVYDFAKVIELAHGGLSGKYTPAPMPEPTMLEAESALRLRIKEIRDTLSAVINTKKKGQPFSLADKSLEQTIKQLDYMASMNPAKDSKAWEKLDVLEQFVKEKLSATQGVKLKPRETEQRPATLAQKVAEVQNAMYPQKTGKVGQVFDQFPTVTREVGETIENYMARKEYQESRIVPVPTNQGIKFVNLDYENSSESKPELTQQEIQDGLNTIVSPGKRLMDIIPIPLRERLSQIANHEQSKPASMEELQAVMNTVLYQAKDKEHLPPLLKPLDFNDDEKITAGEVAFSNSKTETKITQK